MGPQTVLFALAAIVAFGWAVHLAISRQLLVLGVALTVAALEATRDFAISPHDAVDPIDQAFYIGHSGVLFSIGQTQVHFLDLLCLVVAVAGVIGLRRFRGGRLTAFALACLGLLVLAGLVSFAISLGVQPAVNAWRRWIYALSLLLYATTTRRAWRWGDLKVLVAVGLLTCGLATAEILIHGFGSATGWVYGSGTKVNGRPLSESGALLILLAAWAVALMPGRWGPGRVGLLLVLASFVLIAEQRTVWIGAAVSLLVWWVLQIARSGRNVLTRLTWSFSAVVCGAVGLAVTFAVVWQLRASLTPGQTWGWRVSRWQASFATARSPEEWLFGGALGPTPASVISSFRGIYAHSLYVWSIETVGLAGLAALVIVILSLCFSRGALSGRAWPVVVGSLLLAVGYSYGIVEWMWLAVGMCAGWVGSPVGQAVRTTAAAQARIPDQAFPAGLAASRAAAPGP